MSIVSYRATGIKMSFTSAPLSRSFKSRAHSVVKHEPVMTPEEQAKWDALTEDDRDGFFQAMDNLIDRAVAKGRDPEDFHIVGSEALEAYRNRFVLGRIQNVDDDWYRLTRYRGWRIDIDHNWYAQNAQQVALVRTPSGSKYRYRQAVAPRRLSPAAYENFQLLHAENETSVSAEDLAVMAEGLDLG